MKLFKKEIRRIKNDTRELPVDRSEMTSSGDWFWDTDYMPASKLLRNTTVNACVTIIADSVASLSCNVYKKTDQGRKRIDEAPLYHLIRKAPNYYDTAFTFWQKIMINLLLKGNAFIFVERNDDFSPRALYSLNPDDVTIKLDDENDVYYEYRANGKTYKYNTHTILHIPAYRMNSLRGLSPMEYATHSAKLGLTLDEYTNLSFDGGYHQKIALEVDDDLRKNWKKENSKELIEMFKLSYGGKEKINDPIVMARAKVKPLDMPSNSDSQLAENRTYSEKEVAKIFRVPLFMLGSENSKFSNMEQANTFFLRHTLTPWLVRLQQYFDRLLTDPYRENCYVEFDTDTMLRADFNTRWANYRANFQAGLFTLNEIRDFENMPRVDEPYGDVHFGLENYKPLDASMKDDNTSDEGKK